MLFRSGRKLYQDKGRLGLADVFDGEAVGAWQGLRRAYRVDPGATIHVRLDNTSVIRSLTGNAPKSSQEAFLAFQELATIADVHVRWVPGHEGIQGNEEADRLAKEGAALPISAPSQATYAGVKRLRKTIVKDQFAKWWEEASQGCKRYRKLGFTTATLKTLKELDLPRRTLHNFLTLRLGHGDFDWYHKKLQHRRYDRYAYRLLRTLEYLVYCYKTRRYRAR